jgi:hypothetical protein
MSTSSSNDIGIDSFVLLPAGTMPVPDHGVLYAQIKEAKNMTKTNTRFNTSVKKKKLGWMVDVHMDSGIESILVSKSYPLPGYKSDELRGEMDSRPKQFLGQFMAAGLSDADGNEYINYAQVINTKLTEDGGVLCEVKFRALPNGSSQANRTYTGEQVGDNEVTKLQYILGLGMGVPGNFPENRASQYEEKVQTMPVTATLANWKKTFGTIVMVNGQTPILNDRLIPMEPDFTRELEPWMGLHILMEDDEDEFHEVYKSPVRSLGRSFASMGTNDLSAIGHDLENHELQRRNTARQAARGVTEVEPPAPAATADARPGAWNGHPQPTGTGTRPSVTFAEVNKPATQPWTTNPSGETKPALRMEPDPEPTTLKHQQLANKLAYIPTDSQLAKHIVTFRVGAYGKSSTKREAMAGIEIVFELENQMAVTRGEAQVRALCIMQGDLHLMPLGGWRDAASVAFMFEDSWEPIKWTKAPVLDLPDVTSLDEFWRLFYAMEEAVARYYVHAYGRVLGQLRLNILAAIRQMGGLGAFDQLAQPNRVAAIQCAIKYIRIVLSKFVMEILSTRQTDNVVTWIEQEAKQGLVYQTQLAARWSALQLRDINEKVTTPREIPVKGKGAPAPTPPSPGSPLDKEKLRLTPALLALIPKHEGINVCLMSYTTRGCKKTAEICSWHHRGPGSPDLPAALQKWSRAAHGSYLKP